MFISFGQGSTIHPHSATRHRRNVIFRYVVEARYHPSRASSGNPPSCYVWDLDYSPTGTKSHLTTASWPTSTGVRHSRSDHEDGRLVTYVAPSLV